MTVQYLGNIPARQLKMLWFALWFIFTGVGVEACLRRFRGEEGWEIEGGREGVMNWHVKCSIIIPNFYYGTALVGLLIRYE